MHRPRRLTRSHAWDPTRTRAPTCPTRAPTRVLLPYSTRARSRRGVGVGVGQDGYGQLGKRMTG